MQSSSVSHPCGSYRQGVSCVEAPLPVVDRLAIPEDGDLEVLHHGVHHLPKQQQKRRDTLRQSAMLRYVRGQD